MAEDWYNCIASELADVDKVMENITDRAENPLLREMCQYVLSNRGKRVRPAFCILAYYMLGGKDPAKAIDIGLDIITG